MCPEERYPGSRSSLIRGNVPRAEDFRHDHRRGTLLHHRNQAGSDPFSVLGKGPFLDHPDRGKIVGRVRGKFPLDVDHFPLSAAGRDIRQRLPDGVQILFVRRAFHPAQQEIDETRVGDSRLRACKAGAGGAPEPLPASFEERQRAAVPQKKETAILTPPSAILPRFPGPIVVSAGSIVRNGLCAVRHLG